MTAVHYQREVCLAAWLHCEDLLKLVNHARQETTGLHKVLRECSEICLGMLNAFRHRSANTEKLALLCVGICEECAEACETLPAGLFRNCAAACRRCADALSYLACKAI